MLSSLKIWNLSSSLKKRGNAPEAYAAVKELARIGGDKVVDLLIETLQRKDGVARSAANELGHLGNPRAAVPLASMLGVSGMNEASLEALIRLGAGAVDSLVEVLREGEEPIRCHAAHALGQTGAPSAVEPLIDTLSHDDSYDVRIAAAHALGELKDQRAVWVLVATLKMRDESTTEQQSALENLQDAARLALHRIGDPLAGQAADGGTTDELAQAIEAHENALAQGQVHPKLAGDIAHLSEAELAGVLKEVIAASEEISWAKLESRDPLLPPYFDSYEKRCRVAEALGVELHRRGGRRLMDRVYVEDLDRYTAIANWWSAISDWKPPGA